MSGGDKDTARNKPQPLPQEQPQAVTTQSEPAQTLATTSEGLITNVLTPLSQALCDSIIVCSLPLALLNHLLASSK